MPETFRIARRRHRDRFHASQRLIQEGEDERRLNIQDYKESKPASTGVSHMRMMMVKNIASSGPPRTVRFIDERLSSAVAITDCGSWYLGKRSTTIICWTCIDSLRQSIPIYKCERTPANELTLISFPVSTPA